jgi:hypothetical protein
MKHSLNTLIDKWKYITFNFYFYIKNLKSQKIISTYFYRIPSFQLRLHISTSANNPPFLSRYIAVFINNMLFTSQRWEKQRTNIIYLSSLLYKNKNTRQACHKMLIDDLTMLFFFSTLQYCKTTYITNLFFSFIKKR